MICLSYEICLTEWPSLEVRLENFSAKILAEIFIFWPAVFCRKCFGSFFLLFLLDSWCILQFYYLLFRILPDFVFFFRRFLPFFPVFYRFLFRGGPFFKTVIILYQNRFFKNGPPPPHLVGLSFRRLSRNILKFVRWRLFRNKDTS